jgi:hypothetical protein
MQTYGSRVAAVEVVDEFSRSPPRAVGGADYEVEANGSYDVKNE